MNLIKLKNILLTAPISSCGTKKQHDVKKGNITAININITSETSCRKSGYDEILSHIFAKKHHNRDFFHLVHLKVAFEISPLHIENKTAFRVTCT